MGSRTAWGEIREALTWVKTQPSTTFDISSTETYFFLVSQVVKSEDCRAATQLVLAWALKLWP